MNGDAQTNPGQAFATDLRKIREARGLSIEQLHDETKIPRGLIDSFEASGLVDHPMFNRVYLRSFVRTYAEVVGISPDVALASLDQALEERYTNRLAVEYLGAEPPPSPAASPVGGEQAVTEAEPENEGEVVEERIQPMTAVPPPPLRVEDEPLEARPASVVERPQPRTNVVPTSVPRTPRSRRMRDDGGNGQWIWIVAAIAVLAVIAWLVFSLVGGPEPEDVATAEVAVEEGASVENVAEPAPLPPVDIGDSLDVNIVAAGGPVQDIKVTVDDDLRRPYWIEVGESRLFQATDQIIIEQELDVAQLQLEGRPYPTDQVDDQGRIVITRESAEAFLNQAR